MQKDSPKSVEWRNPAFLSQYGLSKENCIDYISEAPHIWDPTSSNAVYKTQLQQLDLTTKLSEYLDKTPGVQFNVTHHLEDLFVIAKQYRESEKSIYPLNTSYISEGNVYASPSCSDLVKMRLMHCMYKLDKVYEKIEDEIHFHPSRGYSFVKDV